MEEIEYLDFVDENNNVIEKEDLCMNDFDYLLEKAKEEKIEKNVVGSVIVNRQGKILIMSRKEVLTNYQAEIWKLEKIYQRH